LYPNPYYSIFLDLNGLDKCGWAKIFVDIANIHRLGVLILLFFDDSLKKLGCNCLN
jgi:hypothetical protein